MVTQQRLQELFDYDPETGRFYNLVSRGRACAGCEAGSASGHGYRKIKVDYGAYYEHQLVWLWTHGVWPEEVDHMNGDRSDNRISNLRLATRTQNCFNAKREPGTSGLKGAYLDSRVSQWYSKIQLGGQVKWLGNYNTAEEAHLAYLAAVDHHHGEFAFHNRPQNKEP